MLLDDCYNSSPEALEAAVVALSLLPGRRRVAVLGDMLELGPTGPGAPPRAGPRARRARGRGRGRRAPGAEIVEGAREAGIPAGSLHHFATAAGRRRRRSPASSGPATRCW